MHLTKISFTPDIERKNTMREESNTFEREYKNFTLSKLSKMEKIWFKLTKHKQNTPGIPLSYFYNYVKLDQTNLIRNLLK